jgi:predicted RNase H-like nuclease (RuvC/YqgF family)
LLTNERLISALKKSPWLQQAQRELEEERNERRQQYLRRIEESTEQFKRTDAALVAKADPLERKLIALRAEVAALEAKFEPLARDRVSAMLINTEEVRLLRVKLRDEADEAKEMLRDIVITRDEVGTNIGGRRGAILHDDAAPTSRITSVLAILLKAYREVERIAVEESDLVGGLDDVRRELAAEGIHLVSRI